MALVYYNLFLLVMGLVGYFVGGSPASLISSVISACWLSLMLLLELRGPLRYGALARLGALLGLALLLLFFVVRTFVQQTFFPTGLAALVTLAVLVLEYQRPRTQENEEPAFLDQD